MEVGKLTVQLRDKSGKGPARQLRTQGFVPGVCYGVGLADPISVQLDPKELKGALDPEKRRNTVIDVEIHNDGKSQKQFKAMVREFQVHPTKQVLTHVDLIAIDPEKKVETEVPIRLVGKHAGAINGGILSWERRSVEVRCKPANIPSEFQLDVSKLDIGDNLHVSDIPLPEGVEFHSSPKLGVVTCVLPRGAEAPTTAAEGEVAEAAAEPAKAAKPAKK